MAKDEGPSDALGRYWNDLVGGHPAETPNLDPALGETVRRFHGLRSASAPDPSFVARLEGDLMQRAMRATPANGTGSIRYLEGRPPTGGVRGVGGTSRRSHRWPVTELTVAALVLLIVATTIAANRLGSGWSDRDEPGLAALQGATPDAEIAIPATAGLPTCAVVPRAMPIPLGVPGTPSGLTGTPAASLVPPTEVTPSGGGGSGPPKFSEDRLPVGSPVDAATGAAIRATMDQMRACSGRDAEPEALFALYSDDYFRRPSTTAGEGISSWIPPGLGGSGSFFEIRDARLLPDGRVGAIVEGPFIPGFFVFVDAEPFWQIDEWLLLFDDLPTPGGSSPGPVAIGVSAACGAIPADDSYSTIAVGGRTVSAAIVASRDHVFRPTELEMAANQEIHLTLLNCGDEVIGFVIDELGVDQRLGPRETLSISFAAAPGVYAYYSDRPGQREAGLVGTLRTVDQGTPTPCATAVEDAAVADVCAEVPDATVAGASSTPTASASAFVPTHQIAVSESVNFRSGPSRDDPPIMALVPHTPLQFLDQRAPTDSPADGPGWMKFRIESGEEGWIREIDIEPYRY